jgi:hypothetical protein
MFDHLAEMSRDQHLDPSDMRRFTSIAPGHQGAPDTQGRRSSQHGQDPTYGTQGSGQGQLAQQDQPVHRLDRHAAQRHQDCHGDGQIDDRVLRQFGRLERHGDSVLAEIESDLLESGSDPDSGLALSAFGETYELEGTGLITSHDLDMDQICVEAMQADGEQLDVAGHGLPPTSALAVPVLFCWSAGRACSAACNSAKSDSSALRSCRRASWREKNVSPLQPA